MRNKRGVWVIKCIAAIIFFVAAFLVNVNYGSKYESFDIEKSISQMLEIILIFIGLFVLIPHKKAELANKTKGFNKKMLVTIFCTLVIIPTTVILGLEFLGEEKYYLLSSIIIAESILMCFFSFERKKASSRELVTISVMCALAIVGRIVFAAIPQFKPMAAVIIISGVAFGGGTGFLIGAVSAFVSNFYFGQGSWTLWQMLAFGIVGFLSGFLTDTGLLKKNHIALSIFGFLAVIFIYGGIVNISSTLMYMPTFSFNAMLGSWVLGLPFDLVHGASTVLFVWFVGVPVLEKLERIKLKYGI